MSNYDNNKQNTNDPWKAAPPAPPNPWEIEKRVTSLEQSTKTIKEQLSKINSNLSKLVWIVISAVLLAGINMILTGGGGIGG